EAFDDPVQRRPWLEPCQPLEAPGGAYITRRKHIQAPEPTQEHEVGAPWADPRVPGQGASGLCAAHGQEALLRQVPRFDRRGDAVKRLGLPATEPAGSQLIDRSVGHHAGIWERVEEPAVVFDGLPETLHYAAHGGHAGIQAQLLEGDDVAERLE